MRGKKDECWWRVQERKQACCVESKVYNFIASSPATPFRGQRPHKTNKTLYRVLQRLEITNHRWTLDLRNDMTDGVLLVFTAVLFLQEFLSVQADLLQLVTQLLQFITLLLHSQLLIHQLLLERTWHWTPVMTDRAPLHTLRTVCRGKDVSSSGHDLSRHMILHDLFVNN